MGRDYIRCVPSMILSFFHLLFLKQQLFFLFGFISGNLCSHSFDFVRSRQGKIALQSSIQDLFNRFTNLGLSIVFDCILPLSLFVELHYKARILQLKFLLWIQFTFNIQLIWIFSFFWSIKIFMNRRRSFQIYLRFWLNQLN